MTLRLGQQIFSDRSTFSVDEEQGRPIFGRLAGVLSLFPLVYHFSARLPGAGHFPLAEGHGLRLPYLGRK